MLKTFIIIIIFILAFLARKALIPFTIGLTIAFILDPLVGLIEAKFKIKRLFCVFLAYFLVIASAAALILAFANIITGKLENGSLQNALATLKTYYLTYQGTLDSLMGFSVKEDNIERLIKSMSGGIVKFLIGMVAGIYLLNDKKYFLMLLKKSMHLLLGQKVHGVVREVLFDIKDVIYAFLKGVFFDSVIVALMSSVVLTVIRVDFAVFIGCFAGIANIIPYFGPVIGIIPAVLAALADGDIPKSIFAAAGLFIVQQIECNLIYPKIIGDSTGLHPLFVLVSVSIAGYFGGLLWMVIAVPVAGIIKVIVTHWACAQ